MKAIGSGTGFIIAILLLAGLLGANPSFGAPFIFSTGNVTDQLGMASRPASAGKIEIETGDDFIAPGQTRINQASFTGLITGGATPASVGQVLVEIYRIFPKDSAAPPSGRVPTRVNSPSDGEFVGRSSAAGELSFSVSSLSNSFTARNSVLNGILPIPNQNTFGEGAVTGQEVRFDVTFHTPIDLPPDHYFFVPQVEVSGGEFFWLSSVRPIVAPGTPFAPDLQTWIRNQNLAPDWLRVGTDIIDGNPPATFNAAFTLDGILLAEPATVALLVLAGMAGVARRHFRRCVT